jgi:hypothetical protein
MERSLRTVRGAALIIGMLAVSTGVAFAGSGSTIWTGQGVQCDENHDCILNTEICGLENGADREGPYLLWVFTGGPRTSSATITIGNCTDTGGAMTQSGGGSWKYISDYCDPTTVTASVSYSYTGPAPANPQLVISHGCRPAGADLWCSPGYWKNAQDAAWAKVTGYTKDTLYNSTSCKDSPAVAGDPTIFQVLSAPSTYGGPATNCVAQLLTDTLCGGGQLNPECPNDNKTICPDTCPYSNGGVLKDDAPDVCQGY